MPTVAIGNQVFSAVRNVPSGSEQFLFRFQLQGNTIAAFYQVNKLRVVCTTGASDFIVRIYLANVLQLQFRGDPQRPGMAEEIEQIQMVSRQVLIGTVQHFDQLTQDFRPTVYGSGAA